jgi:mannose-6-phosphate isomerase-like protein (cupin superfamily)
VRWRVAAALALAGLAVFLGTSRGSSTPPAAVRIPLATGFPSFAPGRQLTLMRVEVPPGTAFAPHRHPGMQVAYVVSGTLTYRVYRGAVKVYRGPADGTQKLVRTISAGHSGSIEAGDWIVETPSLWHSGGNEGKKPVTILTAALLSSKLPIAIPVKP